MNYLEELSLELNKIRTGDYTKINIHFNINDNLLALCEQINSEINSVEESFIKFGPKSIVLPHISLFMGYINSYEQFEYILKITKEFSEKNASFRIDPTRLYIKDTNVTKSKYIFLDLLQNEDICENKKYFGDLLHNKVKPLEWNFQKERPHITLGCFDKTNKKIEKVIAKYYEFPSCELKEIAISISGKKGMCFGNLKSYKLKEL